MACRLFGIKPLPEPMLGQLDPQKQTSVKIKSKYKILIDENVSENVCQIGGHFVQREMS